MSKIIKYIRDNQSALTLGKTTMEVILEAERKLKLAFSEEYKEYTLEFGAVSIGDTEYTGVVNPAHLNVIRATESARRITPNADLEWYVVMDPHIDGIVFWQEKDGKVFKTIPGEIPRKVADSLLELMRDCTGSIL